jgi:hypothetical protein
MLTALSRRDASNPIRVYPLQSFDTLFLFLKLFLTYWLGGITHQIMASSGSVSMVLYLACVRGILILLIRLSYRFVSTL